KRAILSAIDGISTSLDVKSADGRSTLLGFSVGPLTFDHTDDELRRIIRGSFEVAEEKKVAVAFHIDDSMLWMNRKDLWQNPQNVEWTDWKGTLSTHRYIAWLPTKLAPQMCFNSPIIRTEVARLAKDVIGPEIKKGIDALKAKNLERLFAGTIAG